MSYATDYLALMDRYTSGQSQRLMDTARITGAAQMVGAQAWAAVPGQLVDIAHNAGDRYMQIKRQQDMERRTTIADQLAQTKATNDTEDLRLRGLRDDADRADKERTDAITVVKEGAPFFGSTLKEAAVSPENFKRLYPALVTAARVGSKATGQQIEVPTDWTPEVAEALRSLGQQLQSVGQPTGATWRTFEKDGERLQQQFDDRGNAIGQPMPADPGPPPEEKDYTGEEGFIQDTIKVENEERAQRGLPPLAGSDLLKATLAARRQRMEAGRPISMTQGPEPTTVIDQRPDKTTGNQIVPGTGSTANAIFQDAMSYALEGKMPTMGMGNAPRIANARAAIRNTAGALVSAAGVDMPTLRTEYRANSTSLNRMIPLYNQTVAFAESALASARMAEEAGKKVFRTDIPIGNRMYNWLNKTLKGNDKLSEFEVYVFTAARDYAKVTSGGALSIAELSVAAAAKADELLNAAQTPGALSGAIRGISQDMANVMGTQRARIGAVAMTVAQFLDATNPPPVTAADFADHSTQPPPASGWTLGAQPRSIVGPDGQAVTFPTDQAFEAAKQDVGLGGVGKGTGAVQRKTTKFGTFESTDGGLNWTKVGG